MAPRQHTFTLVPNPQGMQGLVSRPQSRPPMTSKQAQKLYKQATRAPRLSAAEQRRVERQEQARIRRELDKEKHASKARTLRDKKKAKAQQALEEKKRKGLPLVDVRPSQDTISRFVRGNGLGKKRDAAGTMVELKAYEKHQSPASGGVHGEIGREETTADNKLRRAKQLAPMPLSPKTPQPQGPSRKPLQDVTNALNPTRRPGPAVDAASKFASPYRAALAPRRAHEPFQPTVPAFKQSRPEASAARVQKPKFLGPHLRPPVPRRLLPPSPASASKQQTVGPQNDYISARPTSTQMFVMSYIDDLFPTPSQEARELQGDDAPAPLANQPSAGPPKRPHITASAMMSACGPATAAPPRPVAVKPAETPILPFISTQDLVMSSQDLRDLEEATTTRCGPGANVSYSKPFNKSKRTCQVVQHQPSPSCRSWPRAAGHPPLAPSNHGTASCIFTSPQQQGRDDGGNRDHAPKHSRVPRNQQTQQNAGPSPGVSADHQAGIADMAGEGTQPLRFFGSGGFRAEVLLALDRSCKTHELEQRKRQAEQPEAQPCSVPRAAAGGKPEAGAPTASQETDYGDVELDTMDVLDLDLGRFGRG